MLNDEIFGEKDHNIDDLLIKNINDIIEIPEIKYNIYKSTYFTTEIIPINTNSNIPLHKFWVYIDRCKIKINGTKFTIALSFKSDTIQIIKKLEKKIANQINNDFEESYKFIKSIRISDNYVPLIRMNIKDENIIFFDEKDNAINFTDYIFSDNISDISENNYSLILELSSVTLNTNKLTPEWRIIQMKKIQFIDINRSLFAKLGNNSGKKNIDDNCQKSELPIMPNQPILQHNIPPPPPPPLFAPQMSLSVPVIQQKENITPKQKPKDVQKKQFNYVPTVADLSNAMGKLKKVIRETNEPIDNTEPTDVEEKVEHVNNQIVPVKNANIKKRNVDIIVLKNIVKLQKKRFNRTVSVFVKINKKHI